MPAGRGGADGSVGGGVGGSGVLRSSGVGVGGIGIAGMPADKGVTGVGGSGVLKNSDIGARGIGISSTEGTAGSVKAGLMGLGSGASTRSSGSASESGGVDIAGVGRGGATGGSAGTADDEVEAALASRCALSSCTSESKPSVAGVAGRGAWQRGHCCVHKSAGVGGRAAGGGVAHYFRRCAGQSRELR
ncbi:hypothetical protein B0H14DRAFT_2776023 [Mycena olivaceomarginata]|nr:hypothetical protein B0H14DRAFT_2776023 [Mycena olivaceomarginata]